MTTHANGTRHGPSATVGDAHLAANTVFFGRLLRRAGLAVDPAQTRLFLRAMLLLGLSRKSDIKAAGRAIYVGRREDRATYDAAFELFWHVHGPASEIQQRLPQLRQGTLSDANRPLGPTPSDSEQVEAPISLRAPSEREQLRQADFASLTAAEARDAQ